MSKHYPKNIFNEFMFKAIGFVGSLLYSFGLLLRKAWAGYSIFTDWWRVSGYRRIIVGMLGDGLNFTTALLFLLICYVAPSVSYENEFWNDDRKYAFTFIDNSGNILGKRGVLQDDSIPFKQIPQHVKNAVLATEDSRFYDHFGIDIIGTGRALVADIKAGGFVQGGSTITQQLAKNHFLTNERTVIRKIREAVLSLWIEANLTKDQIFKLYLDTSYLGGGTRGVEAAAQFYFGKSITEVNIAEAAMIAGLFKAPSDYAPHRNLEAARKRAEVVLYRMYTMSYITEEEMLEAKNNPAVFVPTKHDDNNADYYLDYAYQEGIKLLKEHNLSKEYVITAKLAIDPKMQQHAHKIINQTLTKEGKKFRVNQAALISMTPNGEIKALVGGRDYDKSTFNRATQAERQPGSSFKPFVYLTALRHGFTPGSIVLDAPIRIGRWAPKNYAGRYRGRITLATALKKSINTVSARLINKLGVDNVIETAKLSGIKSKITRNLSIALGTSEVTLLDITSAYSTFANGGKRSEPYTILELQKPNGSVIYSHEKNAPIPQQVIDLEYISDLNHMMSQVVTGGTARRANMGIPQAGKTGTTQSYRDAWFMGYTNHYVTGVWFGNDDNKKMRRVTGGSLPASVWKMYMDKAHNGLEVASLPGIPIGGSKYNSKRNETTIAHNNVEEEILDNIDNSTAANRKKRSKDPVENAFRDIFSLFDDEKKASSGRRSKKRSTIFQPQEANSSGYQNQYRSYRGVEYRNGGSPYNNERYIKKKQRQAIRREKIRKRRIRWSDDPLRADY